MSKLDEGLPSNSSNSVCNFVGLELVRSQEDRMGVARLFSFLSNIVVLLGKASHSSGRDLIERLNLKLSRSVVLDIAIGLPYATAVLDLNLGREEGCGYPLARDPGRPSSRTNQR